MERPPERAPLLRTTGLDRPSAERLPLAPSGAQPAGRERAQQAPADSGAPGRLGSKTWGGLAGIALLAAAALGFGQLGGRPVAVADDFASPQYARHQSGGGGAPVLMKEDRKLTRKVQRALLTGGDLMIPGSPMIPPELVPELAKNDVTWCRMSFFDNCAEDGDWISVHLSNGMVFPRFAILHAGHEIAIPIKGGVAPTATIVAEVDGGGGVTIGSISDDGVWYSAVLPVGGTQQVPVRLR